MRPRQEKPKSRKGGALSNAVFALLIIALLGAGVYMARQQLSQAWGSYTASAQYRDDKAETKEADESLPVKRFAKYHKKNEDVRYILSVDGTEIDYPVATAEEKGNKYYLHGGLDGKYLFSGTLFIDRRTPHGSQIEVIHGHNMRSGTLMFHDLRKFTDREFGKKHRWMKLFDGERNLYYKLAYVAVVRGDQKGFAYITPSFGGESGYESYMDGLSSHALYKLGEGIGENDKVVVLSTCEYTTRQGRLALYYVLQDDATNNGADAPQIVTLAPFSAKAEKCALIVVAAAIAAIAIQAITHLARRRKEEGRYGYPR